MSGSFDHKQYLFLSVTPILVCLPLFSINLFISTLLKRGKKTIGISLGLVFVFYIINVLSELSDKVSFLRYFSLYTLADTRNVISTSSINPLCAIISILLSVLFIFLSYMNYNKKELV